MAHEVETPLSAREASKIVGCSYEYLLKKCQAGLVPHFRVGNRYFFRVTTLQKWLTEQESNSVQNAGQSPYRGSPDRNH